MRPFPAVLATLLALAPAAARAPLTPELVAKIRHVTEVAISPAGDAVAYVLSVPRTPFEGEDGPARAELHLVGATSGEDRTFVGGDVEVSKVAFTPDGRGIAFVAKRGGDAHDALWLIPRDGGEARRVAAPAADVEAFEIAPDGGTVAFLAKDPEPETDAKLRENGFRAEVYEEGSRNVRVFLAPLGAGGTSEPRPLDLPGTASLPRFSPDGSRLALALAPTPLVDDEYMKRTVHVVDVATGKIVASVDHAAKLEDVRFSPDGRGLMLIAGEDLHDPSPGRLFVVPATGGKPRNLLPDLDGEVVAAAWSDASTIVYGVHRGTGAALGTVGIDGSGERTLVARGGPILTKLALSRDGKRAALVASAPTHPEEVFVADLANDAGLVRRTDSNPWLAGVALALQETIRWKARDGLEIEGVLIRPPDARPGERRPLILIVHGGPESHVSDGWVTSYSRPGQVGAARGFYVLYPNYRGSTGRGVSFSKLDQGDYAGAEFDDLVDGVEHLVREGLVDRARVGITGGSYGGFATAWAATKLTEHFAAAVMSFGISDLTSKFGTTDIPNEMFLVHARKYPWDDWAFYLDRSPIRHTANTETPILILAGKDDTRVDPSQSMELFRYLKTRSKAPVRLVLYPGEKHGNKKAAARYDFSLRQLRWLEHYLAGPGGAPPPYRLPQLDSRVGDSAG